MSYLNIINTRPVFLLYIVLAIYSFPLLSYAQTDIGNTTQDDKSSIQADTENIVQDNEPSADISTEKSAQEKAPSPQTEEEAQEAVREKPPFFYFLDEPQESISTRFRKFVKSTDEFFADEDVFYDTTGSYLKLSSEVTWYDKEETEHFTEVSSRIRLPLSEKKVEFLIERDPDVDEDDILRGMDITPERANVDNEYFAGIQATYGDRRTTWEFKPGIGAKTSHPLDFYLRLRITRDFDVGTSSFVRFQEKAYKFRKRPSTSDTSLELNIPFNDNILFRSETGVFQREDEDFYNLRQILSVTHRKSDRRAISYQAGAYGITEPDTHTTQYFLLAHYRENIHSDYLFMDLIPRVTYREENDFHSEYSFTLRLEMIFWG